MTVPNYGRQTLPEAGWNNLTQMLFYGSNSPLMARDRQIVMKQTHAASTHSTPITPRIYPGCLWPQPPTVLMTVSAGRREWGEWTLEDGEKRNRNSALFKRARSCNAYGWMMGGYICLTDFKSTGKDKNRCRMGHTTQQDGGRVRNRKTQLLWTGQVWFGQ